jgi:hypothetical protein
MMSGQATKDMGCNRRILKAFYTQYVAVLLIVLVFTLGAFQRATHSEGGSLPSTNPTAGSLQVGAMTLADVFSEDGSIVGDHAQLLAVITVLKEHDLRVALVIPKNGSSIAHGTRDIAASLKQVEALEAFFNAHSIADEFVRFVIRDPFVHEGDAIQVYFEEMPNESVLL